MSQSFRHASVHATMVSRPDIAAAAVRIARYVRHTPVLHVPGADLGVEVPVVLKLEQLQHAGSFKPRGVFNTLLTLTNRPGVVITASGGNHGAAVAYAAHVLSIAAEVFVPATTPAAKVARITSYGAKVIQTGNSYADALAACHMRQRETGATEIHAYDHPDVLAGQGTVGREFEHDAPDLTDVLVATGGGGLIGGVGAWYGGSVRLISVEPENCPTLHRALMAGQPVDVPVSGVAADALGARRVGQHMFPVAQAFVSEAVLVNDDSILAAQRMLWERFRIIAEPGGATAAAALLSGRFVPRPGAKVGVVVCGGNTDPAKVAS